MRKIPECLSRRYKAADDLMKELSRTPENGSSNHNSTVDDPGVRLMCQFWNILKEHPELNLEQAVKERMDINSESSSFYLPQRFACYMACGGRKDDDKQKSNKPKPDSCCKTQSDTPECGKKYKSETPKSTACASCKTAAPLNDVLGDLNKAASADKVCSDKINELLATQKKLLEQIKYLEEKEKKGIQLLKEVDCMWMCMEDLYKKKLLESLERQNGLLNELKEIESSNIKWRKNQKDLEIEMVHLNKCEQEIMEKINQKANDLKCITIEIENYKKRIASNISELGASKKKITNRKKESEYKIASMNANVSTLQSKLQEYRKVKKDKETEGNNYIKEARDDLQNLSKVLLQKKFENENLIAERNALIVDIETLNDAADQCKDKCKDKEQSIEDEIKALSLEITEFEPRCIHCQKCTDTMDIRKFCVDCPRCVKERFCLLKDDQCYLSSESDCVCMYVKQKFLDNVFENMYTVLERHSKTGPGKSIAKVVLNCLKRSRNGKLDKPTRNVLQDFILSTVGKNLNLTIIGGAVKTRCELDQDTYNQLMLCLNKITATRPPRENKGTAAKKDSCPRWGAASECNCPKGPKNCNCSKNAPKPGFPADHCYQKPTKDDNTEVVACPHKDSACGRECAVHSVTSVIGSEMSSWKPSPCQGPSCKSKNMRAAQCVLGSERASSISNLEDYPTTSHAPDTCVLADQITCDCGSSPTMPCSCSRGLQPNQLKAEVAIQYSITLFHDIIKFENKEKHGLNENVKRSNITVANIKANVMSRKCNETTDQMPNISKTSSGNFKVAINSKVFKLIKQVVSEHSNINETCPNKVVVDGDKVTKTFSKYKENTVSGTSSDVSNLKKNKKYVDNAKSSLIETIKEVSHYNRTNKKFFLKTMIEQKNKKINIGNKENKDNSGHVFRTLSGTLAIDIRDCFNKEERIQNAEKKNIVIQEKEKKLENKENCKNVNHSSYSKVTTYPVRFKGIENSFIESIIALNKQDKGEYKVILNKEFEENIRKTVNDCKFYKSDPSIILLKITSSERCVIDLEPDNTESGNAVVVKNSMGEMKIIVNDPDSKNANIIARGRRYIISRTCIKDLLSNLLIDEQRAKSSSGLRVDNLIKIGNISSESSSFLKGIYPGNFTINFNDNGGASTWINADTFTRDHEIPNTTNLNTKLDINKRCKSLNISTRGSLYILIDDDQYFDSITTSSLNSIKSYINNSLKNCILKVKVNKKVSFCEERLWDTLEWLPPQLPPFLKRYTNT